MSEQDQSWLDVEKQIESEVEKLFIFQDKHITKEKRTILVQEILNQNFPVGAVIRGLNSLMAEDIPSLKLGVIFGSIRKFIAPEENAVNCDSCLGGIIVMRDQEKRSFSLKCNCPRGSQRSGLGLMVWNGESPMMSNGRLLEI